MPGEADLAATVNLVDSVPGELIFRAPAADAAGCMLEIKLDADTYKELGHPRRLMIQICPHLPQEE